MYDAHNAEFLLQRRLADSASPPGRVYSRIQWRRLERFEGEVVRGSRLTLAVSEHDANQLIALAGASANVHVIPNAIDVSAYPFRPVSDPKMMLANVLFVGKLDFGRTPRRWGCFVRRGSATRARGSFVRRRRLAARVAGAAGQHDDRVAVTGYVPDERPYFARCAALVLPVQTGGGSRLKALVAMASGVPILSTRLEMEGLEAEPDVHYLQADGADAWVSALRRVLSDGALRQQLACNARALVEQRYTWAAMRSRVREAYAWLSP